MPTASRAIDRADRLTKRQALEIGEEFHERRLELNQSQDSTARACQMSRVHYGRIERGTAPRLELSEINRVATVLGLTPSLRLYPAGAPVRDVAHSSNLQRFLEPVSAPLTHRLEVPLPAREGTFEQRAWDAVLFGDGKRTAIELEMRLRDVQALIRRIDLKRRDDPTNGFLLLLADTRNNRRVLAEFANLFVDLPRLRPTAVRAAISSGRHPDTGIMLV
jgi:transcriptional regulator with XRE-family HTH domain